MSTQAPIAPPAPAYDPDEIEISLADVIGRVLRGRYVLLATTIIGILIGLTFALMLKPWYTAQAVFLPPSQVSDLSGVTSASSSASALLGGSETSDLYLGMLSSRTVQDDVVDHLDLKSVYNTTSQGAARATLFKHSTFGVGLNALITVTVKADTPKLAADIANAYLDALYRLNGQMGEASADRRRSFFEQQLQQQRDQLTQAEQALKETEEKTGIVLPANEAQAGLVATANLQAQIGDAEARLAGLLVGETDQAPEVRAARAQLGQLRAQLATQEAAGTGTRPGLASAGNLPGLTLQNEEKQREVKLAETAYENLLQQYGRARLASIDPGPQLKVVDRAIPAEGKSGPSLNRMVILGFIGGFLLGFLYLLFFQPLKSLARRSLRSAAAQ